jgi:hypothetical protein
MSRRQLFERASRSADHNWIRRFLRLQKNQPPPPAAAITATPPAALPPSEPLEDDAGCESITDVGVTDGFGDVVVDGSVVGATVVGATVVGGTVGAAVTGGGGFV